MSLRLRLALSFALLAGLVAAAVGLVVYELTQQDLLDRARAKAVSSARDAARFYDRFDVLSPGSMVGRGHGVPLRLRRAVARPARRDLQRARARAAVHLGGRALGARSGRRLRAGLVRPRPGHHRRPAPDPDRGRPGGCRWRRPPRRGAGVAAVTAAARGGGGGGGGAGGGGLRPGGAARARRGGGGAGPP